MKNKITEILKGTERKGIDNVIEFLYDSDYFSAPASTKFHGAEVGGLAKHSYNVMRIMKKLNENIQESYPNDSIEIVGLLHDICKVNIYKPNLLKSGELSKAAPYKKEDPFPIGHGEKSVIMLLDIGLELLKDEMLAIRYHMNMFDEGGYRFASYWNPLSILTFNADYFVTTFLDSQFKK